MQSRQTTDVVLQALLMTVWRRKPKDKILIHSDSGLAVHQHGLGLVPEAPNLVHSMSRRGNCHDNAVAESSLQSNEAGADTSQGLPFKR